MAMTFDGPFAIAGSTVREQAVTLAGVLAEFGVLEVRLTMPGAAPRLARARDTDLPGVLSSGAAVELACEDLGLRVVAERSGGGLMACCARGDVRALLASVGGPRPG